MLQILNFADLAYLFSSLVTVFRAESHEITTYRLTIENGRKELRKKLVKIASLAVFGKTLRRLPNITDSILYPLR